MIPMCLAHFLFELARVHHLFCSHWSEERQILYIPPCSMFLCYKCFHRQLGRLVLEYLHMHINFIQPPEFIYQHLCLKHLYLLVQVYRVTNPLQLCDMTLIIYKTWDIVSVPCQGSGIASILPWRSFICELICPIICPIWVLFLFDFNFWLLCRSM